MVVKTYASLATITWLGWQLGKKAFCKSLENNKKKGHGKCLWVPNQAKCMNLKRFWMESNL